MKEITNRWRVLVVAVCAFAVVAGLTGCKMLSHPDRDIQEYAEALGHLDEAKAKEFALDLSKIRSDSEDPAKDTLDKATSGQADGNAVRTLTDALYDRLKGLDIKTKLLSKDDDKATVEVTTDYIDYASILPGIKASAKKAMEEHQADIAGMSKEEAANYILGLAFEEASDVIKAAEVKGQNTFQTTAVYDKKLDKWVPEDLDSFQLQLYGSMLQPGGYGKDANVTQTK